MFSPSSSSVRPLAGSGMTPKVIGSLPQSSFASVDTFATAHGALLHWSANGLVAIASGSDVLIVDAATAQIVQSLQWHSSPVTAVRWAPIVGSVIAPCACRLATGDVDGNVGLWDVAEGILSRSFQVGTYVKSLTFPQRTKLLSLDFSGDVYELDLESNQTTGDRRLHREKEQTVITFVGSSLCPHGTHALVVESSVQFFEADRQQSPGSGGGTDASPLGTAFPVPTVLRTSGAYPCFSDVAFSAVHPELAFVASGSSIMLFDFSVDMVLASNLIWCHADVVFRLLFSSWRSDVASTTAAAITLPFLYTLSSDGKLTAWLTTSALGVDSDWSSPLISLPIDVRGNRAPNRDVLSVAQDTVDSTKFVAFLQDGNVLFWKLDLELQYWILEASMDLVARVAHISPVSPECIAVSTMNRRIEMIDVLKGEKRKGFAVTTSRADIQEFVCDGQDIAYLATTKPPRPTHTHAATSVELQISVVDLRRGETGYILKPPVATPPLKAMSLDPERKQFLMLLFQNHAVEVWNTHSRAVVYLHGGVNLTHALWASPGFTQTNPDLPSGVGLALVREHGDVSHVHITEEMGMPLTDTCWSRPAVSGASMIDAVLIQSMLLCVESNGTATVTKGTGGQYQSNYLANIHHSVVVQVAVCPQSYRPSSVGSGKISVPLALVFVDGSVGVWDAMTRRRVSSSSETRLPLHVLRAAWVADGHLVLCTNTGALVVVSSDLTTCNSSADLRALTSMPCSPAFLQPKHTASRFVALEFLLQPCRPEDGNGFCTYAEGAQDSTAAANPSNGGTAEKLSQLTFLPKDLRIALLDAIQSRSFGALCLLVAKYFGWADAMRFWDSVLSHCSEWDGRQDQRVNYNWDEADISVAESVERYRKSQQQQQQNEGKECDGKSTPPTLHQLFHEMLAVPPHFLPHPMSFVSMSRAWMVSRITTVCAVRAAVMTQLDGGLSDVFRARMATSRALILCGRRQEASDVLIQSNPFADSYHESATRACLIASTAEHVSQTLKITAKRAAAMFLANGDVDGAVDSFALIHDYYEAALALASRGRWFDAASLIKTSSADPSKLLHDWVADCARQRDDLSPALVLIALNCPQKALAALVSRPECTDLAGSFALFLNQHRQEVRATGAQPTSSRHHVDPGAGTSSEEDDTLDTTISSPDRRFYTMEGEAEWPGTGSPRLAGGTRMEWPDFEALLGDILEEFISIIKSTGPHEQLTEHLKGLARSTSLHSDP